MPRPDDCRHPDCNGEFNCPGCHIPRIPVNDEYFMCAKNRREDKIVWDAMAEIVKEMKKKEDDNA